MPDESIPSTPPQPSGPRIGKPLPEGTVLPPGAKVVAEPPPEGQTVSGHMEPLGEVYCVCPYCGITMRIPKDTEYLRCAVTGLIWHPFF